MSYKPEFKSDWSPEASDDLFEYGYSGFVGWLQNLGHRQIYRWLKNTSGKVFLDLGIGQGGQYIDPSFSPPTIIRSDLIWQNLAKFKSRHTDGHLVVFNAESLPIRTESINHLIAVYMLEHIANLDQCLAEIARVLKPDGTLLLALPAEGGFLYKLGRELNKKIYGKAF